ncbi:hypothetical protein BKA70DRAFT_1459412 [Coprinopsis sp. MPI-PUGE-AT-0042]|nr:hypothetical protein BKA70DRAFT_1459412 [Coprinopsis sp. MPI-PUGE-AT-0042]
MLRIGVRGKERQTVGEVYDLFDSVASEIWPVSSGLDKDDEEDEDEGLSLEQQIAKEVSEIKKPKSEQRFVVFISCKPPVDPVELTMKYVKSVQETGVSRTRHTQRLVPVSGTCYAGIAEMKELCQQVLNDFFAKLEDKEQKLTYKIEPRIRNHTTLTRPTIIQHIASWVPEGHTVSLGDPDMFILVEIFKSVCGISVVRDYYKYSKFNVVELANAKKREDADAAEATAKSTT